MAVRFAHWRLSVNKPPVQLGVVKNTLVYVFNLLCYDKCGLTTTIMNIGGYVMNDDIQSLSHSKWRCKYHIVFAPKYRRQIIYGKIRVEIGRILRTLCDRKGIEIHEAEACPDHIHMLVSIPPKYSVAEIMGYLKGKSSLMIFDRFANMKYRYGNRQFWCRGYYVDTVGRNKKAIEEYIRNQLAEDKQYEQLTMNELIDPFTGEPGKKGK